MDKELRCCACSQYFTEPRTLPCGHTLCTSCARARIVRNQLDEDEGLDASPVAGSPRLLDYSPYKVQLEKGRLAELCTAFKLDGVGKSGLGSTGNLHSMKVSKSVQNFDGCHTGGTDSAQISTLCASKRVNSVSLQPKSEGNSCAKGFQRRSSQPAFAGRSLQRRLSSFETHGCDANFKSNLAVPCGKSTPLVARAEQHCLKEDVEDKVSLISEADSGVVCTGSRPNSYIRTSSLTNLKSSAVTVLEEADTKQFQEGLCCPYCQDWVMLPRGLDSLPLNLVLRKIVMKYNQHAETKLCQLCNREARPATVACSQCKVLYCDACLATCHPSRGPLASHRLVPPSDMDLLPITCMVHPREPVSCYCQTCAAVACSICVQSTIHTNHQLVTLADACQTAKAQLSQAAQLLSERTRAGSQFLSELKILHDDVESSRLDLEAMLVAQFDDLMARIHQKKKELLAVLSEEKIRRQTLLIDQSREGSQYLNACTGLLQLSVEVLKESDPLKFLTAFQPLVSRLSSETAAFNDALMLQPAADASFTVKLADTGAISGIESIQLVDTRGPTAPQFVQQECYAEQNTLTLSWKPSDASARFSQLDGFLLELRDSGDSIAGDVDEGFSVVYRGSETLCIVEGLHFDTAYEARVCAYNAAGRSVSSRLLCLSTSEVAWLTLSRGVDDSCLIFGEDGCSVTSVLSEHHVGLADVGLARGQHYWEFLIENYDNDCDPAFGVARFDVNRNQMLGKDSKSWSLYTDTSRSWLMHAGVHVRRHEVGLGQHAAGACVGLLLDLSQHTLSFYMNGRRVGGGRPAFTDLHGVLYPAVSVNRNVRVRLRSGLRAPSAESWSD